MLLFLGSLSILNNNKKAGEKKNYYFEIEIVAFCDLYGINCIVRISSSAHSSPIAHSAYLYLFSNSWMCFSYSFTLFLSSFFFESAFQWFYFHMREKRKTREEQTEKNIWKIELPCSLEMKWFTILKEWNENDKKC